MEILQEFDFDYREPTSQWASYIDTLIEGSDDGRPVAAIKLELGEDIAVKTGLENAHTGLLNYARKRGRSARVRKFPGASPPYLVVGLRAEGEAQRAPRRRRSARAVVNA